MRKLLALFLTSILTVAPMWSQSTKVGSITTTSLNSHTWNAAAMAGTDAGAKIASAIGLASAGDIVDLSGFTSAQAISAQLTISKSLTFTGCRTTFTVSMSDPGQSSGAVLISASNVNFVGAGQGKCIITQANAQNIQSIIQTGGQGGIFFSNLTLNGNEANQTTHSAKFYSCWAAEAGGAGTGHDLSLVDSELTGCGDRAVDWRAITRAHLERNYCHDTGVNIAGGGSTTHGDCLHVGTDGFVNSSSDVWIVNNEIDKWGDSALACDESSDCHIIGNTLRGQANFGTSPNSNQGGLDTSGSQHVDIINNTIFDVPNNLATNSCENLGSGHISNATHYTIINNHVYETAASVLSGTPAWQIGGATLTCTTQDFVFSGNVLYNTSLFINGIDTFSITGNTFHYSTSSGNLDVIDVAQSGGPVAQNFVIANNAIEVDSGASSPTSGINFGASITSPNACTVANNTITSNISSASQIVWQSGSAGANACASRSFSLARYSADSTGAGFTFNKSRGTIASPAAIQAFDSAGNFNWFGYDGSTFTQMSELSCHPIGTISAGVVSGQCTGYSWNGSGSQTTSFGWDYTTLYAYQSLSIPALTNGADLIAVTRATDSSPTGSFGKFLNHAGAQLSGIDILGNFNTNTLTAAVVTTQLATPSTLAVVPSCTGTCATTWTYKVIALDAGGNTTPASSGTSTTAQAATLDGTHFNTITWKYEGGAVSYKVYRTAVGTSPTTTGVIATISVGSVLSVVDNGLAGDTTSPPSINTTGVNTPPSFAQSALPAWPNGNIAYCSDCKNVVDNSVTAGAACVASGAGALARRENGRWDCN